MNRELWKTGGLVAPALLLTACAGQKNDSDAQKPFNIIHIMTDDHSYQTLSAYGHALGQLAPTPNLDKLAAQGMLFRQAFVENSLSTPSRACLMTGLYSHQNGQRQLGGRESTRPRPSFPSSCNSTGTKRPSWANGTCSANRKDSTTTRSCGTRENIITLNSEAKKQTAST